MIGTAGCSESGVNWMKRNMIDPSELHVHIHALWERRWMALISGDWHAGNFNAMTVAWGSLGCMWKKPFAQVVVRPTRYTFEFMETFDTFTLNAFPDAFQKALMILGSRSGRHGDKIADAGLKPGPSQVVAAPCFQEASLVLECQKIYWDDMKPGQFLDPAIENQYPEKDYHRIYFGEVLAVQKTAKS